MNMKLVEEIQLNYFWEVLDTIFSATRDIASLKEILGVSFTRFSGNKYYDLYENKETLAPGTLLERVEVQIMKGERIASTVSLAIKQPCVSLSHIQNRFSPLFPAPLSGESIGEPVFYITEQTFGSVSFGFQQTPPACLEQVVVRNETAR